MSPCEVARVLSAMGLSVGLERAEQLAIYMDLLLRWNDRMNLSAVREPGEIVLRHFGESLQCARMIPPGVSTLLDYGSGAGFPGAVCALERPELAVTLAESQTKKAAFLQELCRSLALMAAVHAGRVDSLPPERRFDAVTLRAVDRMEQACMEARERVRVGGWLMILCSRQSLRSLAPELPRVAWRPPTPLHGAEQRVLAMGRVLAD